MNSEKVKEIKKALEYAIQVGLDKFSLGASFTDILTLINELESENERLNKALVDNLEAYKDGFNEGASLKKGVADKLKTENRQLKDRLAELEDKIENGTLIEFDITDKDILEEYAHRMFNSWNDTTGAIHECSSWYIEILSVIDDIVGMVYGITKRQAKLKELKGEV